MFGMEYATSEDVKFWLEVDHGLAPEELAMKIAMRRCYVIRKGGVPVGVLRYGMFWDVHPFLNLLWIRERYRGDGLGRKAMAKWEGEMRGRGYRVALTSTQSDERGQFFYRQIGYGDCGCLVLDTVPVRQPLEIFMIKVL